MTLLVDSSKTFSLANDLQNKKYNFNKNELFYESPNAHVAAVQPA